MQRHDGECACLLGVAQGPALASRWPHEIDEEGWTEDSADQETGSHVASRHNDKCPYLSALVLVIAMSAIQPIDAI